MCPKVPEVTFLLQERINHQGTSKNQFRQLFEVPCGTCLLG